MAVKIAGIISIIVAFLGLLIFALIWFDRRAKQQNEERKQRLIEKDHADNFTLNLFNMILEDDQLRTEQLVLSNTKKDEQISALQQEIQNMKDIAAKCGLKDIYEKQEAEQALKDIAAKCGLKDF